MFAMIEWILEEGWCWFQLQARQGFDKQVHVRVQLWKILLVRLISVYHELHDFLQELDVGDHIELQVASILVDPGRSPE